MTVLPSRLKADEDYRQNREHHLALCEELERL